MINIESLPLPTVFEKLDYETTLESNVNFLKEYLLEKGIVWQPVESDPYMIMCEAFSYRELSNKADFNEKAKAFFLSTAKGDDLDNISAFYNVERLQGSFPYAPYEFELSTLLDNDVLISKGLVLTDETSTHQAILLEDVIIPFGSTKANGILVLQEEIAQSDVKTEIITTPLPYLLSAKALNIFNNGSEVESDANLLKATTISMADKSTAGSEESYKSYTYKADERIEDVKAINGGPAVVNIFYYSANSDEIMKTRIEETLNAKDVRPLTDQVIIQEAEKISFDVEAVLRILPNQENATVLTNAISSLETGLAALKKIGTSITLSEINDFLRVQGVKEVIITKPTANVVITDSQIGINNANTITYTII